ncbi:hypothetical protein BD779DRAFT_552194 [Infundibulicybe gibba]|nr:hypothetical protein BD779DRAFT_552194 [Infundibulicybe gibba]
MDDVDSETSRDACEFWDDVVNIPRAGTCALQRCASTTISSREKLDREEQALRDTMEVMRYDFENEESALYGMIQALRERRAHENDMIARSIVTIRSRRNSLAPVMRLPPEILSRIFIFHVQVEERWLKAALTSTHVCRQWRQIGIDCPGLWSRIDINHCRSEVITAIIDRSRQWP